MRVLVNVTVFALLVLSALAVVEVVKRSTEPEAKSNIWRMNEITIVMTSISTCFPMLFEGLGIVEKYHPRKQLRLQLARWGPTSCCFLSLNIFLTAGSCCLIY